jgi:hypothetical protein
MSGNTISGSFTNAVGITINNGAVAEYAIIGNNFVNNTDDPMVSVQCFSGAKINGQINSNEFKQNNVTGSAIISIAVQNAGSTISNQIDGNTFQGNTGTNSVNATASSSGSMCLQMNNNAFDLPASLTGAAGAPLYLETPSGNTGPAIVETNVTPVAPGTCE